MAKWEFITRKSRNEHYRQFSPDSQRDQALHDAELIAAAFGALERHPYNP